MCTPCPTGSYCKAAATAAIKCNAGTYKTRRNNPTARTASPATRVWLARRLKRHARLDLGDAASKADLCEICAAGTYQDQAQQTSCNTCPAGSACTRGSTGPTACEPGSYSASGAPVCTDCVAGKYQSASGASSCVDVDAGYYSLARAATQLACSPGTFSASGGQSSCVQRPAGTYQLSPGQTSCTACTSGSFCTAGATAPTACPAGSYRGAPGAMTPQDCIACPAGFACVTGAITPMPCLPAYTKRADPL